MTAVKVRQNTGDYRPYTGYGSHNSYIRLIRSTVDTPICTEPYEKLRNPTVTAACTSSSCLQQPASKEFSPFSCLITDSSAGSPLRCSGEGRLMTSSQA